MTKKHLMLLSLVVLAVRVVFANEGGGHGEAHHDEGLTDAVLKTVIYQAINVGLIIVGLVYFLRAKVRQFFVDKKATYVAAAEKAKVARQAAEDERMQIQVQLNKLISTADESVSRAKTEAADMKLQLLAEAQALSKRIREEAAATARLEVEKARNHLREELLKESFSIAQSQMNSKVSSDDHARLQGEFINNIQAVQR